MALKMSDLHVCTVSDGLYNSSVLTVYNHMLKFAPDGVVSDIEGYAFTTDDVAKLTVELDGAPRVGNCKYQNSNMHEYYIHLNC